MKLEHEFTVPAPIDEAWKVLQDVERIAPCMPGATLLTIDGDTFTGTVKVKVGPIQVTYKGQAEFKDRDDAAHRLVIEASGKEARGSGTAMAAVTTALLAEGDTTRVWVETELNVTGRPAQFGRGVMEEVSAKLIGQFAKCLAEEMGSSGTGGAAAASSPSSPGGNSAPSSPQFPQGSSRPDAAATSAPPSSEGPRSVAPPARETQPIDLLDVAGESIAKRLAPVAAVLAVLLLIVWRRRRRQ